MRGKVGLVIGVGIGYVLGTRAGRERYEQIKTQASSLWNTDTVQKQVGKVTDFAKSSALALPTSLWNSAVKVTKAAKHSDGDAGDRLDAAVKAGKDSADDVADAAETSKRSVKKVASDVADAAHRDRS